MKNVAFVVHAGRPRALDVASRLVKELKDEGVGSRALEGEAIGAAESGLAAAIASDVELVVAIGGDGTFLRAAQLASAEGRPVLGVKVGRMGFLTEVEPEEALDVIRRALDGKASIEERMALEAQTVMAPWAHPQWALNEVIVEKTSRHRLIKLAVRVDGEPVTTFSADGVIVSTPTGSTTYAFSARGPIVSPDLDCLVVTPVAAHMVFDRSLVLARDQRITLEVVGEEPGVVSADGRESVELPLGETVEIVAAPKGTRLVRRPGGPSFFGLVRDKFGLPAGDGGDGGDDR
jgi:NAD+ kinase